MQDGPERGGPLEIRSKIWIERRGRGDVVLSEWRVELLEAIDAHGSLSRAAEALDVPYRTAWERVKATEGEIGFRSEPPHPTSPRSLPSIPPRLRWHPGGRQSPFRGRVPRRRRRSLGSRSLSPILVPEAKHRQL